MTFRKKQNYGEDEKISELSGFAGLVVDGSGGGWELGTNRWKTENFKLVKLCILYDTIMMRYICKNA